MSHFAEIDPDTKIVKRVIVAEQDFINSGTVGDSSNWIQTSYNTRGGVHYAPNTNTPDGGLALRKNYAGIGYIYDSGRDAFMVPQPFPSWTLNEDTCYWESPTPYPVNGRDYKWNEETKSWEKIE
jgi:hypothetical protein|tara:strand:+ start:159 stop:533 length:375 start_codon:yes stop_codon:yes gene_type:complete